MSVVRDKINFPLRRLREISVRSAQTKQTQGTTATSAYNNILALCVLVYFPFISTKINLLLFFAAAFMSLTEYGSHDEASCPPLLHLWLEIPPIQGLPPWAGFLNRPRERDDS